MQLPFGNLCEVENKISLFKLRKLRCRKKYLQIPNKHDYHGIFQINVLSRLGRYNFGDTIVPLNNFDICNPEIFLTAFTRHHFKVLTFFLLLGPRRFLS